MFGGGVVHDQMVGVKEWSEGQSVVKGAHGREMVQEVAVAAVVSGWCPQLQSLCLSITCLHKQQTGLWASHKVAGCSPV